MCFFKGPKVAAVTPNALTALDTVKETKAPEPQAPVFGGTEENLRSAGLVSSETAGKKGISSLKIPRTEAGSANVTTGANQSTGGMNAARM